MQVTFDYPGIVVVNPEFYLRRLTPSQSRQDASGIAEALRHLPGVDATTISSYPPLTRRLWIEHAGSSQLIMNAVDASYFSLMHLPLLQGHLFESGEADAVIVSESAARRIWPKEAPLGKGLLIETRNAPSWVW